MESPKTVSLVLGSGAARGLAHIGVIERLEEEGYKIESIAGCSIGALVGGIYCTGKLDVYRDWLLALDRPSVLRLLDFSFSRTGLFKGEKVLNQLLSMIGDYNIEELPVRYTAVATDIEREKEIWFTHGSLFRAIRASIAVPSIFTPHEYMDMKLMDGGLLDPVPIAPTIGDHTDMTIAVNLNGKPAIRPLIPPETEKVVEKTPAWQKKINEMIEHIRGEKEPDNAQVPVENLGFVDLLAHSVDLMQNTIAHAKMSVSRPDILIEIPRNSAGFFDYDRADELITLGRILTEEALEKYAFRHQLNDIIDDQTPS